MVFIDADPRIHTRLGSVIILSGDFVGEIRISRSGALALAAPISGIAAGIAGDTQEYTTSDHRPQLPGPTPRLGREALISCSTPER